MGSYSGEGNAGGFALKFDIEYPALEELDGVITPASDEPHDGCVRVDDRGSIGYDNLRMFAGESDEWQDWEWIFPQGSSFTAYIDHPECYGVLEN